MTTLACAILSVLIAAPSAQPAATQPPHASAPVEFLFDERSVYPLVAAPGRLTDIMLEPGETLVEANPIAAGDTARWIIGDATSGAGETRRVHILVKPTAGDLSTNMVINTTRRTYFLELRASDRAFLTQVRWRYPAAPAIAPVPAASIAPMALAAPPPPTPQLNLAYKIRGPAELRPVRVWDDGARTYVEFPPATILADLPPLFVTGPDGKAAELVNYHVAGRVLIVDRLLEAAELRLGVGKAARRVRIERKAARGEAAQ
ncbi:MAG: P-type conjugative transfer protein TrbG [Proteobacteria bacterium]|nr:P-type conjugative transfer protein TrbG [Pseudomonadota bacterium]